MCLMPNARHEYSNNNFRIEVSPLFVCMDAYVSCRTKIRMKNWMEKIPIKYYESQWFLRSCESCFSSVSQNDVSQTQNNCSINIEFIRTSYNTLRKFSQSLASYFFSYKLHIKNWLLINTNSIKINWTNFKLNYILENMWWNLEYVANTKRTAIPFWRWKTKFSLSSSNRTVKREKIRRTPDS